MFFTSVGGSNSRKKPFAPECNAPTHYTFQQENTRSKRGSDKKMPQTSFYGAEIHRVISDDCANSKKRIKRLFKPNTGLRLQLVQAVSPLIRSSLRRNPLWGLSQDRFSAQVMSPLQISHPESVTMTTPCSSSASP